MIAYFYSLSIDLCASFCVVNELEVEQETQDMQWNSTI